MILSQDIRAFIQSLNDSGVRYLIVGGYAVALHGYPRYTKDIDVWIECNAENASRVIKALDAFGFASLGLSEADFIQADIVVQLGYPPNRIDMLTGIPGVKFAECYPSRVDTQIDNLTVSFIDLISLKLAKMASGRPQDLADVANLR